MYSEGGSAGMRKRGKRKRKGEEAMNKMRIQLCTYFPVFRKVDFQGLGVVLEPE